jgi:hypothetical protein
METATDRPGLVRGGGVLGDGDLGPRIASSAATSSGVLGRSPAKS